MNSICESEVAKIIEERDHYKERSENLYKRISKIHMIADNIPDDSRYMMIDLTELRRRLKLTAFGQPYLRKEKK